MLAVGTGAVAGARIVGRVVAVLVVAGRQLAVVHDDRITGDQVLDAADGLNGSVGIHGRPTRRQLNHVTHFEGSHHSLVGVAGDREAGIIVTQGEFIFPGNDLGNREPHGTSGVPVAAIDKIQVVVVALIMAACAVSDPVVLEDAIAGIGRAIQADLARHGTAIHIVVFQGLSELVGIDETAPFQSSHHDGLVMSDASCTCILRTTDPHIGRVVEIHNGGIVAHYTALGRAQSEIGQREIATGDPEVSIAGHKGTLGGRAMTLHGIGEQLGLADCAVSVGSLNTVIGIVEVNLDHINIERHVGDAHNRVDHARSHLTTDQRIGRIGFTAYHKVGMGCQHGECPQHNGHQ